MYPIYLHEHRIVPDLVCNRLSKSKQLVEIILLKEEIIRDIDADTLKVEKARGNESQTPIATDERQRYEACRYIDRAVNKVVKRCSAYLLLPSPFVHRISTNHAKGWEEKSIYLALPHNWPPHLTDSVRDCAHDHVVKFAEAQLLTPILSPSDAYVQYCSLAAETALDDLEAAINERLGMTDIHPTPFG